MRAADDDEEEEEEEDERVMIASSRYFSVAASSSARGADERRRRRRNKNELWCRPCFNKMTVESSMRRTRVKATRNEDEEDFEDVSSSFSFMVSSGNDNNNNNSNNNNNRRMNRKERRRLLGERKKQRSEKEEEDNKDDESNEVKERMIEMTRSSSEENNSKLEPRGTAAEKTRTTTTTVSRSDDATAEPEVVLTTDDMQQEGWAFTFPKSVNELSDTYQSAPARYKLMVCCACAFVVCNMDKINMSVAVIPMSREFSWDTAQSGILQSSFFYGFALSQIPGGFLNTKFGGARVLPLGLTFISLATLAIPVAGDNLPALFFARALVGLGEGVVPSAVTDIIARAMPVGERSRAVAFTFSGFNVGSILGLSVAPFIMEKTGWRGMFDIFGSFGALWIVLALGMFAAGGVTTKAIDEGKTPVTNLFGSRQEAEEEPGKPKEEITFENVPWGQFANSDPIKALAFVHFVGNWGTYVVLAWLPTYFTQEVGLSLTNASLLTLLPPIANIAVGTLAGPTADGLIQRGTDLTIVRKGCQSVAFAAPAFAMLLSTYFEDPVATVILLTIGISFQSFSYAGLYSNHQDLSPKYASILLGITNTCGALPGVIGVPLTGYLIKETQEWELSMFGPAIILYSLGIAAYWKWGSGERLVFETKVNVE